MESLVADVLLWLITWIPWLGLAFAFGCLCFGVLAMDEEGGIGRDYLLLSIATSLIIGLFVALLRVQ